jgi:hypothetical protein
MNVSPRQTRYARRGFAALLVAASLTLGLVAANHTDAQAAACQTGGAAGSNNLSAYNAGYYDGLCGQYIWFGYGYNYNNYCSLASYYAASQGIGTTGTGVCANGTYYNNYAGGYHGQCRYWEYYGFGFDHNGYCSLAATYVSAGACSGCL